MSDTQRQEIAEKVRKVMCSGEFCGYKFMAVKMEDMNEFDRVAMVERHLISPDFASGDSGKLLITTENEEISVMVGEEDHLRIQVILPDFDIEKALEIADKLDTELDRNLHFAFDKRLGCQRHTVDNITFSGSIFYVACYHKLNLRIFFGVSPTYLDSMSA